MHLSGTVKTWLVTILIAIWAIGSVVGETISVEQKADCITIANKQALVKYDSLFHDEWPDFEFCLGFRD